MAATQIILLERIDNLGKMGDIVEVKPGYARNYLLPQKKALRATKSNLAHFEAQRKVIEADTAKAQKEAEKLAKKIDGLKAPLVRQASEAGKLYGSVTSRDIADAISQVSGETISRTNVILNTAFKSIGLFPVTIQLHPEVKVEVIVNIARSAEEAQIQAETGRALISEAAEPVIAAYEEAPAEEAPVEAEESEEAKSEE